MQLKVITFGLINLIFMWIWLHTNILNSPARTLIVLFTQSCKLSTIFILFKMVRKHIQVEGETISYVEANEYKQVTLFFIHGNSLSANTWFKQLDCKSLCSYRLIALDLPGHGHSSGDSDNTDFSLPSLGSIVAASIKQLKGNQPYFLIGHSLGTSILAEALKHELKPIGIVLASSWIVGSGITVQNFIKPDTNVYVVFSDRPRKAEIEIYAKQVRFFDDDEKEISVFVDDYQKVTNGFRTALGESIRQMKYNDQISLLKGTNLPILCVFGVNDQIIRADYLDSMGLSLWQDALFKLSNAGHLLHQDEPDPFNALLINYIRDCLTKV